VFSPLALLDGRLRQDKSNLRSAVLPDHDTTRTPAIVDDAAGAVRDVLFISKGTPEDDDFVMWLAPRLEAEGYRDAYILVTAHEAAVAAARAEGMLAGLLRAAELPAYDGDGDPSGTFDHKVFVKIDAIRAEAALTKIARLGQDFDAAEPLTEYERKVAQMREDFPNGI